LHLIIDTEIVVLPKLKTVNKTLNEMLKKTSILNKKALQRGFKMNHLKIGKLLSSLDRNRTGVLLATSYLDRKEVLEVLLYFFGQHIENLNVKLNVVIAK
jgi:hypothetical protein